MTPEQYDSWYRTGPGEWMGEREYRLVRHYLRPRSYETVLDSGCGTGYFTRRLAYDQDANVVGIDPDPEAIRYARLKTVKSETYAVARGEDLPFPSDSFDLSVSITALCFADDQLQFLKELARVTRRRIAVGLLYRHSLLWLKKGRCGGTGAYQGARWHTLQEALGLFKAAGLPSPLARTAINLPSGSKVSRLLERLLPDSFPWGGFLLVVCDVDKRVRTPPLIAAIFSS
ncbi:MAG: class I SAM-dependent methyltransferase [Spirochaetia bacterium]